MLLGISVVCPKGASSEALPEDGLKKRYVQGYPATRAGPGRSGQTRADRSPIRNLSTPASSLRQASISLKVS